MVVVLAALLVCASMLLIYALLRTEEHHLERRKVLNGRAISHTSKEHLGTEEVVHERQRPERKRRAASG